MKIIARDNFNRETINDIVIAENVESHWAEKIAKLLNDSSGNNSSYCYSAEHDDFKPFVFEP